MKISKKIIALIMAVLMASTLLACSNNSAEGSVSPSSQNSSPSADSSSAAPSPSESAPVSPPDGESLSKQGYFDPDKDYSARDQYQIAFIIHSSITSMHKMFIDAYGRYGTVMNYELKDFTSNSDADIYLNLIETLATQGYDGYILDFAVEIRDRVIEVTDELDLVWFPGLSTLADEDGNLLHPSRSMNNYQYGTEMTEWLAGAATEAWGSFDHKELGLITTNYSVIADINARAVGAFDKFKEIYPDIAETNYWDADGVTNNSFTSDGMYAIVSSIISANPHIKYWFVASTMDDYASGAARAIEAAGKVDTSLVTATGGTTLVSEWDKGLQSCWKSCIYSEANLTAKTVMAGLISMIDGDTTPETLWPKWIQPGQKYAKLLSPGYLLTKDNYQEFFEWCDVYTGLDLHDYPYNGTVFEIDF